MATTTFFAVLDGNGLPTAFYSSDLFPAQGDGSANAAIPASAVPISSDVHADCILNAGLRKIVNGVSVAIPAPAAGVIIQQVISRRQFATQAAIQNDITQGEALAWLAGTVPTVLTSAIGKLPEAQQFPALMAMLTDTFDRSNPWTATIGSTLGKSSDQMDAMWIAAAALP